MKEIKQHNAVSSILLHLLPGLLVLVLIYTFSHPVFTELLGFDKRLSPVIGYLFGVLVGVIGVLLAILLLAGKLESGVFSIKSVVQYTKKSRLQAYLLYVPAFIAWFLILFVGVAPLIQPYIVDGLFSWWPREYNFQLLLQNPASLAGYQGIQGVALIYILLSGIFGPLVEELYFRGYLLPRMENYAGEMGAPDQYGALLSLSFLFTVGKSDPHYCRLSDDLHGVEEA